MRLSGKPSQQPESKSSTTTSEEEGRTILAMPTSTKQVEYPEDSASTPTNNFDSRLADLDLKRKRMLKRQRRLDRLQILTLTLAILLILSGLGFITYTTSIDYRHASHTFATVQAQWTQNVVNTAQARTQSTVNAINTVQANINATATSQAQTQAQATVASEDATATATALESLLTETTEKTPNLDDPLIDRDGDGEWDIGGNTSTGCVFTDSGYHAFVAKRGYIQPCLSQASTYTDLLYSAQVSVNTGNGNRAGLIFRANNNGDQYYFFGVGIDGTYGLDLYQSNGQHQTLFSGRDTANIISQGLGQSNRLAILAQGDIFYLFANDTFLGSAQDATLASGHLGVAVLQSDIPIDATFSDAQAWKI
ncbi:hypothetical protein [Ktedonospora formicarum]|uniref:Uncharacterized protein n=1 Tax=Ktedonospora formicarum TaxID=2778364 RepID=A0A8J3HWP3_9CHLR|nr:hypothetical protein [Ktedonospora formicarum]GHO43396.1 hypothetical protein KSX_15590 [Ktedonospora formicarum]